MVDGGIAERVGTMVDANAHLWDQAAIPVFWLSDRTTLVDMLGDDSYDEIFRARSEQERRRLFHDTAILWLGTRPPR